MLKKLSVVIHTSLFAGKTLFIGLAIESQSPREKQCLAFERDYSHVNAYSSIGKW